MTQNTTDDDSRLSTSTSDDVDAFVPDDATAVNDDEAFVSTIYITDRAHYYTGVHCSQCFCGVARHERGTGVVSCPNCEWSSDDSSDDATEEAA
jgi:hypothetical protein